MRVSKIWSAYGPTELVGPRIVTVSAELSDVEPIASSLEKLNTGSLLNYSRQSELRFNPPVGEIDLFVLVDREYRETADDTLHWLGRYWPGVATVLIGAAGSGGQEMMARAGGAIYIVHPGSQQQWRSLVELAVQRTGRTDAPAA